jgi:catechol 2,3-dioxygenase-like lactoylglutathione lyase family enzyme
MTKERTMQLEHVGLNIEGAKEMVAWYREHLGMPIHREGHDPVYVAYFGEAPTLLEVYDNPAAPYFSTANLAPLTFHLAWYSNDLAADRDRLVAAGAVHIDGEPDAQGHGLLMLRCPWGLPVQLCNRYPPLVA